jgi:hypothetical protein
MADITKAIFSVRLNFRNFRKIKQAFLIAKYGIDTTSDTEIIYNEKYYEDSVPIVYNIKPISLEEP